MNPPQKLVNRFRFTGRLFAALPVHRQRVDRTCKASARLSLIFALGSFSSAGYAQDAFVSEVVITVAGANSAGSADGVGTAARFSSPSAVAWDQVRGEIYVADTNNHTIRRIKVSSALSTPTLIYRSQEIGTVTTVAGQPGVSGPSTANGTGGAVRFNSPHGVAVDRYLLVGLTGTGGTGNVYVADTSNHAIRKITPDGVVTTLAGGTAGSVDGTGAGARFFSPWSVAVDRSGNVIVADSANHAIRKVTPDGVVTTLAGALGPGGFGSNDGVGGAAKFASPRGVSVDGDGNIYVADRDNNMIRKVTPAGVVTTLAGVSNGTTGSIDGLVSVARFNGPYAVAAEPAPRQNGPLNGDSVHVVDSSNATHRWILNENGATNVFTLAGRATFVGSADGAGTAARFNFPQGITWGERANGTLYIADTVNHTIRMVRGQVSLSFRDQPSNLSLDPGGSGALTAELWPSDLNVTYQWQKDGTAIPGATNRFIALNNVQASDLGNYRLVATNVIGSATSQPGVVSFKTLVAGRLTNLSILTNVAAAGESFTMGYVVGGSGTSGSKPMLIRAAGPTLGAAPFNIPGALADPKLELFAGATKTTENDNWGGTPALSAAFGSVGAFAYVSGTSLDAAVSTAINAGDNSVRVSATGNGTGTVIAELYDSTPFLNMTAASPRLVNVSVLKNIGAGLTAGFVIDGNAAKKILIRAVGPTIGAAPFNVGGTVADPQLTLFSGSNSIGSNDNWGGTAELVAAFAQVGAFALPAASRDAALLATLQPGNYTVQVSGVGGTTGVAIVEVYEVP